MNKIQNIKVVARRTRPYTQFIHEHLVFALIKSSLNKNLGSSGGFVTLIENFSTLWKSRSNVGHLYLSPTQLIKTCILLSQIITHHPTLPPFHKQILRHSNHLGSLHVCATLYNRVPCTSWLSQLHCAHRGRMIYVC